MTDGGTAPGADARRAAALRSITTPLAAAAWVFERLLSRRGLCLGFLLLLVVRTRGGWLRPPLGCDISSFALPLFGHRPWHRLPAGGLGAETATSLPQGGGEFVWFSAGTVMALLIAVGVVVVLIRPARFHLAAGLLLCGATACLSSAAFNHPALIAQLDRQHQQRQELVSILRATADPPIEITLASRVQAPPATAEQRGSLRRGLVYLRYGGSLLLLSAAGLALSLRGPLSRRLGHVALWGLAGAVLAAGVSFGRLTAEWRWQRAVEADARGRFDAAERHAAAARARFPALDRLERTWIFLGKLDYRRGRASPARDCFRAHQLARNGELRQAIAVIHDLARSGRASPTAKPCHADLVAQLALAEFRQGRLQAAEDLWRRASKLDPAQTYRPLFVAAIRARTDRENPDAVAGIVAPLLDRMADRAMRGALLAMLGDAYFQAGRFAEAAARYNDSIAAYSLPKQINYRAQRGLVGM